VYLLENGSINAMSSYNRLVLSGIPSLVVEGIAVSQAIQGKGFFKDVTEIARSNEAVICLRTQNPFMYRALEKYCSYIYPGQNRMPVAVKAIQDDLASHLSCGIDEQGVIKGFYEGLFYGEKPVHRFVSPLFEKLGMDVNNGDAVLAIGIK
jgi:hypothetical protein